MPPPVWFCNPDEIQIYVSPNEPTTLRICRLTNQTNKKSAVAASTKTTRKPKQANATPDGKPPAKPRTRTAVTAASSASSAAAAAAAEKARNSPRRLKLKVSSLSAETKKATAPSTPRKNGMSSKRDEESDNDDDSASDAEIEADADSKPIFVGRENEIGTLRSFLTACIRELGARSTKSRPPHAMYISGLPGSGKTASVSSVIAEIAEAAKLKYRPVAVNCLSLSSPGQLFTSIETLVIEQGTGNGVRRNAIKKQLRKAENFNFSGSPNAKIAAASPTYCSARLRHILTSPSRRTHTHILVLDEADALVSRNKTELYALFDLTLLDNVVVIAIANSIDLTRRILPLLEPRGIAPALLNFDAYETDTVRRILEHMFSDDSVISRRALDYVARKQEAHDVRWALGVCRKAIRVSGVLKTRADLVHVVRAAQTDVSAVRRIAELALPARLALIALLPPAESVQRSAVADCNDINSVSRNHAPSSSFTTWHLNFSKLCAHALFCLPALSALDFRDLATRLESIGVVRVGSLDSRHSAGKAVRRLSFGAGNMSPIRGGGFSPLNSPTLSAHVADVELLVPPDEVVRGVIGGALAESSGSIGSLLRQLMAELGVAKASQMPTGL